MTTTSTTEGESTTEAQNWQSNSSYSDTSGDHYDKDGNLSGNDTGSGETYGDAEGGSIATTAMKNITTTTSPMSIGIPIPYWQDSNTTFNPLAEAQEKYTLKLQDQAPRDHILLGRGSRPVERSTGTVLPIPLLSIQRARYLTKILPVAPPSSSVYDASIRPNEIANKNRDHEPPTSEPIRRGRADD